MRIVIAQRLQPFSHTSGTVTVVPGSSYEVQVFPSLIVLRDLSGPLPVLKEEVSVDLKGPVDDFSVSLDLEKGLIHVWGHAQNGYFRYHLRALQDGRIGLFIEKSPENGLHFSSSNLIHIYESKSEKPILLSWANLDRLSLGNHKAQDWDLVTRRMDLAEILPAWYRLGQLVPSSFQKIEKTSGTAQLLHLCEESIRSRSTLQLVPNFKNAFIACFQGILSPRLQDLKHHGFALPESSPLDKGSALTLLSKGSELIRSMFIQSKGNQADILPALPPEFHCGRMTQVRWENIGHLDLEWSKKTLRRLILHAEVTEVVELGFQNQLKRFRLRQSEKDRGEVLSCGTPVNIIAGNHYLFDNFQH